MTWEIRVGDVLDRLRQMPDESVHGVVTSPPSDEHTAATVLDPFAGSGTTIMVALQLGRSGLGIELNPEYAAMARRRIVNDAPLFNSMAAAGG